MITKRVYLKKPLVVSWVYDPHGFAEVKIFVLPFFEKLKNKTFVTVSAEGVVTIYNDRIDKVLGKFKVAITYV